MRIAVTASGPALDSRFEPCFSSAAYFVIYETASHRSQWYAAGCEFDPLPEKEDAAVQELAELNIDVVVTGHVSHLLAAGLDAAGIRVCRHRWATVKDALEEFTLFDQLFDADPIGKVRQEPCPET